MPPRASIAMNTWIISFFSSLLTYFFLGFVPDARAQIPVPDSVVVTTADSLRPARPDTLGKSRFVLIDSLNYRFIGDGNFSRGNITRSLLVLRAEITFLGPDISIVSHPRFAYGNQNGVLAERDIFADLFIDVLKKRSIYGFALGTLERSNLRQIEWRKLAGIGIGWRLLQTRHHELSLTDALIRETTDFRERPTISVNRNSVRLKGKHVLLQDKFRLSHITFLQPALENISNFRWNTNIGLELPINKWVAIRTGFEHSFESVVEAGRQRGDTRFTFGISMGNRPL